MKAIAIPIIVVLTVAILAIYFNSRTIDLPEGETIVVTPSIMPNDADSVVLEDTASEDNVGNNLPSTRTSTRTILETDGIKHSVPLDEIKQGCFGRDCIPSVDKPEFVSMQEADKILKDNDTLGIGVVFQNEERFYPFNMLVTREIVNDQIGDHFFAVTYCPLCGTGIVFNRKLDDKILEFGVSGFLWQSNLLMYTRGVPEDEISLFSQVLGEAVLGPSTGAKLDTISSEILLYSQWKKKYPKSKVLNTGSVGDPYGGQYYSVAKNFDPNFDESESVLDPSAYVEGIEIDGKFKAYPIDLLPVGNTSDSFAGKSLRIEKDANSVVNIIVSGERDYRPSITGFWFSWAAAHPETELWE